jgi:hypothetical protein
MRGRVIVLNTTVLSPFGDWLGFETAVSHPNVLFDDDTFDGDCAICALPFFNFFLNPFLCTSGHITPRSTSLLVQISESTCAVLISSPFICVPYNYVCKIHL